jgi:hypothetical protein
MSRTGTSTRRSFIAVAGAALSAPVAAAAATFPAVVERTDPLKRRVEQLEDLNAIRALNQDYCRHVNAGAHEQLAALFDDPAEGTIATGISGIAADGNEEDAIEVATDRRTATARLWRTVYRQTAIGPSCTLVEMARLQGGGVVTRADATVVENVYVCRNGVWKFRRVSHRPA